MSETKDLAYPGTVDKAIEDLYVEVIREVSKQTGTEEDTIRNWFETLTSSRTRKGSGLHVSNLWPNPPFFFPKEDS